MANLTNLQAIACTSFDRVDYATAEDYLAIEEFAIADITSKIHKIVTDQIGSHLAIRRDSCAIFIRSWREYENGRRNQVDWMVFDTAKDRKSALLKIANSRCVYSERKGPRSQVRATSTSSEMADLLDRLNSQRIEDLEKEAQRAHRLSHKAASDAAFERMCLGTESGRLLGEKWNAWIEQMKSNEVFRTIFQSNSELMSLYQAVVNATKVPAKRRAINACLKADKLAQTNRRKRP